MSGIYIANMEMPKSCGDCKFCLVRSGDAIAESDMFCFLTDKELCLYRNRESINNVKIGDCPLKKVPTHGDLKDVKKIKEILTKNFDANADSLVYFILSLIEETDTVVEASKERE